MTTESGEAPLSEMAQRLEALQAPLSQMVDLGIHLHKATRPGAPQFLDGWRNSDCWYVSSSNTLHGLPISDTLTLQLAKDAYLDIEKYNGATLTQPVWRFDHWSQYDINRTRLTRVQVFHEQSGATFPFDVETSLYNSANSLHLGFLGAGYQDQEPYIETMVDQMLSFLTEDTAKQGNRE